jgi:hypothetical protein
MSRFLSSSSRNPFNSQSLIAHLANSNGSGNLQSKVLLTVSPLPPSFHPQPRVYPRLLSVLTTHQPLPTSPRPLFSYTYEFPRPTDRSAGPLFSSSYELLFSQALCFDNHLRCPLFFGSAPSAFSATGACSDPVGVTTRCLTPLLTYSCELFVEAKKVNSFAIKQIQTLSAKHPGWGVSAQPLHSPRLCVILFPAFCQFLLVTLLLMAAPAAEAWGCRGHETIALLAERHPTPAAKQALLALLTANPIDPQLKRYCGKPGWMPLSMLPPGLTMSEAGIRPPHRGISSICLWARRTARHRPFAGRVAA